MYRRCCKSILEHIRQELNDECSRGQLKHGLHRVSQRLISYSGLSSATIYRLLNDDNVLDDCEDETRDRERKVTEENEALIRPAVLAVIERSGINCMELTYFAAFYQLGIQN